MPGRLKFKHLVRTCGILLALVACLNCGSNQEVDSYYTVPRLIGQFSPGPTNSGFRPVRLQLFEDTLYVSYDAAARIDKYNLDLELVDSILLIDPEPVNPTSFVLDDSILVVASHARHLIVIYDRQGEFRQSFGTTPDGRPLSPFALAAYGGVAYIADLNLQRVLAISLVDAEGITERGELILMIPTDSNVTIGFPSAVEVTPDGRLLIGDAAKGLIRGFTCDGRHIYDFDRAPGELPFAPQGFARDNVIDPGLQDSSSFDPSGIRSHGRTHVVDANNGKVHMYSPLGRYLASYPSDSTLTKPSGIVADHRGRRIFVADPAEGVVLIFEYDR